ncbi:F0F1 ATP synthase subunit gamma [Microbulbifer variabilis]|uniref:F0F1 ATP synthase subunit gamma n=1 Tax=Microbulbifer variabilis TaxID=266805 RepID=UPI001CFEA10B|nr:F0F1 ATP synthase subunit gamma [Microbulbifer variabilis]
MSRQQELKNHRKQLTETRQIIGAMQSLSFIEVHRLRQVLDLQRQITKGLVRAAKDLLCFNPNLLPKIEPLKQLFLVVGSERGFCGDFNDQLLKKLQQCLTDPTGKDAGILVCGRKIGNRLENHPQLLKVLDGAAVLDEIDTTLMHLIEIFTKMKDGMLALTVIYHGERRKSDIIQHQLLPPFEILEDIQQEFAFPPQINLRPVQLFTELLEQYLFTALNEILYVSLMAENQHRIQHLAGAIRHLDHRLESLRQKQNQLRQEEIIEEIEVILLNSADPSSPSSGR